MKPVFLILLIILTAGCQNRKNDQPPLVSEPVAIRGIGKIIPEQEIIQLAMPTSGTVAEIQVNENDSVTAQTPLLVLKSDTQNEELAVAQAAIVSQKASLEAQKAQVAEEEARLKNLQTEYERITRLYNAGAETGQARENAETNLKVQQAVVTRAQREAQRESSKLTEAMRNAGLKTATLQDRVLKAPVNGKILEITVRPGEYVQEGSVIGQFQPDGRQIATCEIDELFASRIKNGQKAYILSVGGVDTLGTGKVIYTADFLKKKSLFYEEAGEAEDRRVLEIKILPNKRLPVLLNSKVECSIHP